MTEMTRTSRPAGVLLTVGQVAEQFNVTVRTLHHYDQIGLLTPGEHSPAGYRLYTEQDLTRLQHVVVYRRLGFSLEEIALLLVDESGSNVVAHLRRQREAVMSRLDEMRDLVVAIDQALEQEMSGMKLTRQEQKELFGEDFDDDYAEEAERRWGDTEAYQESQRRAATYSKEQWVQIKTEGDAINAEFVAAMQAGLPATSERAMDVAEQARLQMDRWFFPMPHEMHRDISDMYIADPRFTKTYEDIAPGLAQYVRDAVHANFDRKVGSATS